LRDSVRNSPTTDSVSADEDFIGTWSFFFVMRVERNTSIQLFGHKVDFFMLKHVVYRTATVH